MNDRINVAWNGFFHLEIDARVYSVIRIAVAFFLIVYAAVLAPDWIRWFGEKGVMSREAGLENIDSDTWSLLNLFPATSASLWAIYGAFVLQSVFLLIGWRSKTQAVCLFLWILSLHHRNNLIWEGGDVLLRLTLFLMMFMPLGARWSIDSLRSGSRPRVSAWPLRLLQLQQSVLYASSVLRKLQGEDWTSGVALFYTFRLDEFSGRVGTFRLSEDFLWIYQSLTWLALAIEMMLVIAVWIPSTRKPAVIIGIVFHLCLELSMNLFLFQWLMVLILSTHLLETSSLSTQKLPLIRFMSRSR